MPWAFDTVFNLQHDVQANEHSVHTMHMDSPLTMSTDLYSLKDLVRGTHKIRETAFLSSTFHMWYLIGTSA